MRRRTAALLALSLVAGSGLSATATGPPAYAAAKIERRLAGSGPLGAFITFDHPVRAGDIDRLGALGITKMHAFRLVPTVAVVAPRAVLERVARWTDVAHIRSNDPIAFHTDKSKRATRVDQVRADKPKGLGRTGKGVKVAVIDSGIDQTHPDFEGQVDTLLNFEGGWIYDNPQDGRFTDRLAEATGPYAGIDEHGHGTHTASTVLGTGAAALNGVDYSGMAPGARLVVMKIAGGAQGSLYDFGYEINCMIAIEYAVEHQKELGIKVVSNSWSVYEVDDPRTEPLILMVGAAVRKGLTFVFAAGNNGPEDETVSWPGALGSVITVAATSKAQPYAVASFSSRGYQVDLAAPGEDIFAARAHTQMYPEDLLLSVPEAGANAPMYMAISGTSMAAPHIAGIAALMFEANPRLTPALVEEILERTAYDKGDTGKDHAYGYGFVDALRATQVASCLARSARSRRETCFTAYQALPRGRWASDFDDPGDLSGTAQGSDLPIG